ncbi:metal cation symporter ZIP14-like [Anopheles albimanus]|uniref:metal cation symporter ZIP14-like n=1 Tax=Anopheles albimanus TaxID=7167 RepID=UPI0016413B05|nr:metal cation symporter ZIP14-like [Anopheles albimanus]
MMAFRRPSPASALAMMLVAAAVWLATVGPSGIAALDEVTAETLAAASAVPPSSDQSKKLEQPQTTTQTTTATPPAADSENKFLKYLFNKYGSKGVISFEGLEHLMHSLGLGGLDFPGSHTLKEHRPEGYDFGDYDDVYAGEQSPSPGHHHDHHHHQENGQQIEDGVTMEPPVITFANTIPQEAGPARDRVPQEQHHHHHHDHLGDHDGSSTVTPTQPVPPNTHASKGTTAVRGTTPALNEVDDGDHVWQEMSFKDIHDPRHRHPRNKNVPYCLSPMSIVHLVMEEPVLAKQANLRHRRSLAHHQLHELRHDEAADDGAIAGDARIEITPSEFKDLCPAFLVQLDQRACTQKLQREAQNPRREKKPFTQAWIYASASVLIISLCGLVGVAMVPLAKSIAYDDILRFLIGLGVGTLCGDALMHLLPHALLPHGEEEHDHEAHGEDHDHSAESRAVWLCLCCFGAAFFMYSLEMILPLFRDGNSTHGHSHGPSAQSNRVDPQQPASSGQPHHHHHHQHQSSDDIELDHGELSKEREANTMLAKKGGAKPMAAVAFMVILGDGLHNITDGLAIGGAFAIDPVMGLATSFAILCHELPHELGDFALLLQTGVSIRRAIFLNIVSSVLSFIGMALGLLLTGLHESVVSWIYAATAGTFLYIALSDLVPEMRNDLSRCDQKLKVILTQLSGLALGAVIMLLIALNEDSLQRLFE